MSKNYYILTDWMTSPVLVKSARSFTVGVNEITEFITEGNSKPISLFDYEVDDAIALGKAYKSLRDKAKPWSKSQMDKRFHGKA
tara:strand:- start:325 stop:576 length:252 start_codon:yes stop_codon:yes gene_type:complete